MVNDKYIVTQDVRTHYLEAGRGGPTLVLVHSGEFGASAALSWEPILAPLARQFHVIAPDLLGYGQTDKIVEFGLPFSDRHRRRMVHLAAFLEALGIGAAVFVGSSMGGGMLTQDAASDEPRLKMRLLVTIGGASPNNVEARAALTAFDGGAESMRRLLSYAFHDPKWIADDYVQRRLQSALAPGAFEAIASARLMAPGRTPGAAPREDLTPYERVRIPVLIAVGAHDRCIPGWGEEAARRIPRARLAVFRDSGHCPHLEEPEAFVRVLTQFVQEGGL